MRLIVGIIIYERQWENKGKCLLVSAFGLIYNMQSYGMIIGGESMFDFIRKFFSSNNVTIINGHVAGDDTKTELRDFDETKS